MLGSVSQNYTIEDLLQKDNKAALAKKKKKKLSQEIDNMDSYSR
jgi:hypothetical protein